jgi:TonB family protein
MKNSLLAILSMLLISTGFSQNFKYEYSGRYTPAIKKEKLFFAGSLAEIMPEFNRYFALPAKDRNQMDIMVNMTDSQPVYSVFPQESFMKYIDFVSVEISAISEGKTFTAESSGVLLTSEQKNILSNADWGTDIHIKIKFSYKNPANDKYATTEKIKEGYYTVTVVPATEAEFPGGTTKITAYLTDNILDEISSTYASEKIRQAVVNFTVDEEGQIIDAKMFRTSTDPEIDKLILEATNRMPKWRPAENSKGIKVKQVVSIPFGGGGC